MAVFFLGLQGSFNEHKAVLRRLGVKGIKISKPEQLRNVTSFIIPGGESTTMAKLPQYHNLFPALSEFVKMGKPVWGTCVGLIFWQTMLVGRKQEGKNLLEVLIVWFTGTSLAVSFKALRLSFQFLKLAAKEGGPQSFRGVFIHAPAILDVGPEVQVLADITVSSDNASCSDLATQNQEFIMRQKTIPGLDIIVSLETYAMIYMPALRMLTESKSCHRIFKCFN